MNLKELRNARRERVEPHIRTLLAQEGCPACIEAAHGETDYFSWLLIETYGFPEWLAEFSTGWGFCQTHGNRLLRRSKAGDQISYVHSYAATRILHQFAEASSGKTLAMGPCPACRSMDEISLRTLVFLRKLLLSADDHARYGRPGLLCFSHFRTLLPWMPWKSVTTLLRQHETALKDAAEAFRKVTAIAGDVSRTSAELTAIMHLTVGHAPRYPIWPAADCDARREARDPVNDYAQLLADSDFCPICIEVRHTWCEWLAWLDDAARDPSVTVDDLLPTCGEHAWALIQHAAPPLRTIVANHLADLTLGRIGSADRALSRPPPKRRPGWKTLRDHLAGNRRRVDNARNITTLPIPCPVCNELNVVRDRMIMLLFALVRQSHCRADFEAGHGLCLKHFHRALTLAPDRATTEILLHTASAKLTALQWELNESLRKRSWSVRPEAGGTEQDAWQRAITRFSGSFWLPEEHGDHATARALSHL